MHPLILNLAEIKDSELDSKIGDLTKKYFMTTNAELKMQIVNVLDTYKEEQSRRQQAAWQKAAESQNKDLDKLIKVS
jgi:hypothetical protein